MAADGMIWYEFIWNDSIWLWGKGIFMEVDYRMKLNVKRKERREK